MHSKFRMTCGLPNPQLIIISKINCRMGNRQLIQKFKCIAGYRICKDEQHRKKTMEVKDGVVLKYIFKMAKF